MAHSQNDGPGLTILGKLIMVLFIGACGFGAWWLISRDGGKGGSPESSNPGNSSGTTSEAQEPDSKSKAENRTTVRLAYGTEKKRWLTWAVDEFEKTPDGKKIEIELLPMGSLEGARATIAGEEHINVWSPASSAYRNVFVDEWQLKYGGGNPIAREETLALSPMVFVFWKERHDAFVSHYQTVDFNTIAEALHEPGGWGTIANKPEWGFFKFGHTNPNESNSGLLSLALMAQHFHDKTRPLTMADIVDPAFQQWLRTIEGSVSGLSNSTGNMMRDMVLKGPASFDAIFVYENVAIDYLKNAEGRWGSLQVIYPKINLWNDNPYYVIDAEWTSKEVRKAAEIFLDYLMSEPVQQQSLTHGFRPGNPSVPIKGTDSPFTMYAKYGLQIDLPAIAEPPASDAINNLLTGWQRIRSAR
ncbi:MAG: substrate-binding domain-containing protein [Verrucomicrobiae bacterium]|nr:substrate-binding domain-containing protein [Verrucomicrobiae bacterium]